MLKAASLGCRVTAFEPNPAPRAMLLLSRYLAHFHHHITVHAAGISDHRSTLHMEVPKDWGFGKVTEGEAVAQAASDVVGGVHLAPLGDFVQEDILLMKVDTEGYEDQVFGGESLQVLSSFKVHNVVAEVKSFNTPHKRELLHNISRAGTLRHIYTYEEAYYAPYHAVKDNLGSRIFDISSIILESKDSIQLKYEDYWLRREPLPQGMFQVFNSP